MGAKRERDDERTADLAAELTDTTRRLVSVAAALPADERDAMLAALTEVDRALLAALDPVADVNGSSFEQTRAALGGAMRRATPRERLVWHGGPMTVRWALRNRIAATWRALDATAETTGAVRPGATRSVIQLALELLPHHFIHAGRVPPDATVEVDLDGPEGDRWVLRGPVPADWPAPTDRITGPAVDLCRLVCGRVDRSVTTLVAHGAIADTWLDIVDAFAYGDVPR